MSCIFLSCLDFFMATNSLNEKKMKMVPTKAYMMSKTTRFSWLIALGS